MTTQFIDNGETELERNKETRLKAEAIKAGSPTYFTGKPCIWGHVGPRRVSDSDCTECILMRIARKAERSGRKYVKRGPQLQRNTDTLYGAAVGGPSDYYTALSNL